MKNHNLLTIRFRTAFLCLLLCAALPAKAGNDDLTYTFLINHAPEGFNLPLLGLLNTAKGDHYGIQAGLINTNEGTFSGLQAALINTIGDHQNGAQFGLLNTTGERMHGLQAGLINTVGKDASFLQAGLLNSVGRSFRGAQLGLINTTGRELLGVQAGLLNTCRTGKGFQVGMINTVRSLQGSQIGFLNATRSITGLQVGFINTVRSISGFQIGFINVARSVSDGVPVGFLSFVREGGLKAFELSLTEMYPVNLSFKLGVPAFYTFPIVSWHPAQTNRTAWGFGCGSYLSLSDRYYVNPELSSHHLFTNTNDWFGTLSLNIGYRVTSSLDFLVGPSLTRIHSASLNPFFSFSQTVLNSENRWVTGARMALRHHF